MRRFFIEETGLSESWKNNTPFYYYHKKWFAFISYDPKTKEIYISFVKGGLIEHTNLVSEGRKKMKIYRINPHENIDVGELKTIVSKLKTLY